MPPLDLCHLFVFTHPGAPEAAALDRQGLTPTYRRRHPGQGTANLCYCFDNAYLELLWVEDQAELASCALSRCGWAERTDWRNSGANPFGIGVRTPVPPFPAWDYRPGYLPPGLSVPVATASDDPAVPFLFGSPGSLRPDQWPNDRSGNRQTSGKYKEIQSVDLFVTEKILSHPDFWQLQQNDLLTLKTASSPRLILTLSRPDGTPSRRLCLPDFLWLD